MPERQTANSTNTAHASVEPHAHVITGPVRVRRRGEETPEPADPVTLTPEPAQPPPPPPPPANS